MSDTPERINSHFETDLQNLIYELLQNSMSEPTTQQRPPAAGGGSRRNPPYIPTQRYTRPISVDRSYDQDERLSTIRDIMRMFNDNIQIYQLNMRAYIDSVNYVLHNIINMPEATRRPSYRHLPPPPTPTSRTPPRTMHQNLSYILFPGIGTQFQDVVVRPSTEQIERATELIEYRPNLQLTNLRCPITLDEFQEGDIIRRIRHCGHAFKSQSLENWFETNVRCPICRYDIRTYQNPDRNTSNEEIVEEMEDVEDIEDVSNVNHSSNLNTSSPSATTSSSSSSSNPNPLPTTNRLRNESLLLTSGINDLFQSLSNNLSDGLTRLTNHLDLSNGLIYRLEIPIDYEEQYDSSDNLIGRRIIGFPR